MRIEPPLEPQNNPPNDVPCDKKSSCFKNLLSHKIWKTKENDLLKVFIEIQNKIKQSLNYLLTNKGPIKYYFTIKLTFEKQGQSEETIRKTVYLNGRTRVLLRVEDFQEGYEDCQKVILAKFDDWIREGSGWRQGVHTCVFKGT